MTPIIPIVLITCAGCVAPTTARPRARGPAAQALILFFLFCGCVTRQPGAPLETRTTALPLPAETERLQHPRTLEEARARNQLAGQKNKFHSGTKLRGLLALDVKFTPFSSYDAAFIAAVQQRWHDLLDTSQFAQRSGKVELAFRLTHDGRITNIKTTQNEVGEMLSFLCQRALLDPAPYPPWPEDMRRMIGAKHRAATLTFYYYRDDADPALEADKQRVVSYLLAHPELAPAIKFAILAGRPFTGMTPDQALAAFGKPQNRFVTQAGDSFFEQWSYPGLNLYFQADQLTSYQIEVAP